MTSAKEPKFTGVRGASMCLGRGENDQEWRYINERAMREIAFFAAKAEQCLRSHSNALEDMVTDPKNASKYRVIAREAKEDAASYSHDVFRRAADPLVEPDSYGWSSRHSHAPTKASNAAPT